MDLNSKKLERTSKFLYFLISITLCVFLILLFGKILGDLNYAVKRPIIESFEDKPALSALNFEIDKYSQEIEDLYLKKETIEKTMRAARGNYQNEKESFENWLKTRKTLGSPDKDQEVIDRARRLDEFYKIEQQWRGQENSIQEQIDKIKTKRESINQSFESQSSKARQQYNKAVNVYHIKVFLVRLLFVFPILAFGIYFFIKCRGHKFYPLFRGFTLFSVYIFFFGLLPYIPSWGGYVRYSVGVLLTAGLGYYAIKRIRAYIEQKQAELKASAQERAKKVQTDTADKALENHFCPSCGKDFIMKAWEFPGKDNNKNVTYFCRYCGMELFKICPNCSSRNFAHLPFCSSCGTKIVSDK
ncbi:MAG: hypothetical protein LBO62_04670 [Endomicrobium sp.]|jgi:rubrerythrin|nr:hypothetical protein [Endomicrobium sp.]